MYSSVELLYGGRLIRHTSLFPVISSVRLRTPVPFLIVPVYHPFS